MSISTNTTNSFRWYSFSFRRRLFFGNLFIHFVAGAIYVGIALLPLMVFVCEGGENIKQHLSDWLKDGGNRAGTVGWMFFVTMSYPGWMWMENRSFEKSIKQADLAEDKLKEARRVFELNTKLADSFWKSLPAIYTVAGIWSLTLK